MRPVAWAGLAAAGTAALAHGGPGLTALPVVRKRLLPGLTGYGRPGHLALTFDDGPDPASTMRFVEALDRLGWKATFFMLGAMARLAPGLVGEVAAAGHEVGVHGDAHISQLARTPRAVAADLLRARDTLAELTGTPPVFCRPPYGVLAGSGLWAARRAGLRVVLWSAWGRDWREDATAASVLDDLRAGIPPGPAGQAPGPTLLLHDSDCTSAPGAWRSALETLPLMAEWLGPLGWEVGPLRDHYGAADRWAGAA